MKSFTIVEMTSVLTGIKLGFDGISVIFLSFTSLLWLISGIYAYFYMKGQKKNSSFFIFYVISAIGNIGLILAQDIVSFYLFFALMTFAAYPLVIYDKTPEARYAGKIYIVMAIIGEVMLISAAMLIAAVAVSTAFSDVANAIAISPNQNIILGLVIAGFGIKAGAIFLHMWLPLAHPVAPTPASAVLSGVMIKAGLLGWIRFLPVGEIGLPEWGSLFIAAGTVAIFYGVFAGFAQDNPKTVLAYSSISQMGIMTSCIGVGLSAPDLWQMTVSAILIYAVHHALNKAALFLGVGIAERAGLSNRKIVAYCLLLPSLSLAGAPFTSGYAAKVITKDLSAIYYGNLHATLELMLPLASVSTTVLMMRFLFLITIKEKTGKGSESLIGLSVSWLALLICSAVVWLLPFGGFMEYPDEIYSAKDIFSSLLSIFAGAIFFLMVFRLYKNRRWIKIPSGDILLPIAAFLMWIKTCWIKYMYEPLPFNKWKNPSSLKSLTLFRKTVSPDSVKHIAHNLSDLSAVGIVFVLLVIILYVILVL